MIYEVTNLIGLFLMLILHIMMNVAELFLGNITSNLKCSDFFVSFFLVLHKVFCNSADRYPDFFSILKYIFIILETNSHFFFYQLQILFCLKEICFHFQ